MTNTTSAITFALMVYGIGAAISFFVALLIKGMSWSLHFFKRS